jgi:hypothetical protein
MISPTTRAALNRERFHWLSEASRLEATFGAVDSQVRHCRGIADGVSRAIEIIDNHELADVLRAVAEVEQRRAQECTL